MKQKKCKVFLLAGFLGSGKTTLLTELLNVPPEGEKLAVLMNEFGRIGVDGDIIRRNGLEMVEVNRGSIFCACAKGDFLRALHMLITDWKPTLLLIEASGIADTRDMQKDLGFRQLGNFFELWGNICVVDGEHFLSWAECFNAVPQQVEAASLIVLNKMDMVNPDELPVIREKIRELNPDAPIFETSFGKLPWSQILKDKEPEHISENLPSAEDWESFVDERLEDAEAHLAPPDKFYPQSILWLGEAEKFKQMIADSMPEDLVRAKGYFFDSEHNSWFLFSIVEGSSVTYSTFESPDFSSETNLAVFIRSEDKSFEIPKKFKDAGLTVKAIRN